MNTLIPHKTITPQPTSKVRWSEVFNDGIEIGKVFRVPTTHMRSCSTRLNQLRFKTKSIPQGDYVDILVSGKLNHRPERDEMISQLRRLGVKKLRAVVAACKEKGLI